MSKTLFYLFMNDVYLEIDKRRQNHQFYILKDKNEVVKLKFPESLIMK